MTHKIISEKSLPESELEISAEISYETLAKHRASAIKKISEKANIPGFRVGHAPENIVVQKYGELAILEEAAYDGIDEALYEIFSAKKISIIGEPRVNITKIAAGNPLQFNITVSVMSEVKLPDYKKIAATENAKKPEDVSLSEKEIKDFIDSVRKSYAENTAPQNPPSPVSESKTENKSEVVLPELTNEFVKKLGQFKDVTDFKIKIAKNLELDKAHKAVEKKRLSIAEAILKKTDVVVPKALIESELTKLLARFHDDIAQMGIKIEDYLKHIKKTEDDMRKEWREDAKKRGKLQLVFDEIAKIEKISAPTEAVEEEMKRLLENYKKADPDRARNYVTMMLTNEKVFEWLESK